jgi:hypothetical protein
MYKKIYPRIYIAVMYSHLGGGVEKFPAGERERERTVYLNLNNG